jgi:hypothetical protein
MADYRRQQHFSRDGGLPVWGPRERGGYWRQYEASRQAEDVAERVSDARDVTNRLRVTRNRDGHDWAADSSRAAGTGNTSSQPVSEAVGKGTSSKTTSRTSA